MGICLSQEEQKEKEQRELCQKLNDDIDAQFEAKCKQQPPVKTILLLGNSRAGKSTLFRQLVAKYTAGYTVDQFKSFIPKIHKSIILLFQDLIDRAHTIHDDITSNINWRVWKTPKPSDPAVAKIVATQAEDFVEKLNEDTPIDAEVACHLATLWQDRGFQFAFNLDKYDLYFDWAQYFGEKVQQLALPDYVPSLQDILRFSMPGRNFRPGGISEAMLPVNDQLTVHLIDVDANVSNKIRRICFNSVDAVVFVASLAAYHPTWYREEHTNALDESVSDFYSHFFIPAQKFLVLTKHDMLPELLPRHPYKYDDFKGEQTPQRWTEYVKGRFEETARYHDNQVVDPYMVCPLNVQEVEQLFVSICNALTRQRGPA